MRMPREPHAFAVMLRGIPVLRAIRESMAPESDAFWLADNQLRTSGPSERST
jgi:hypothetical protein